MGAISGSGLTGNPNPVVEGAKAAGGGISWVYHKLTDNKYRDTDTILAQAGDARASQKKQVESDRDAFKKDPTDSKAAIKFADDLASLAKDEGLFLENKDDLKQAIQASLYSIVDPKRQGGDHKNIGDSNVDKIATNAVNNLGDLPRKDSE